MKKFILIPAMIFILFLFSNFQKKQFNSSDDKLFSDKTIVYILPLGEVKSDYVNSIKNSIEDFYGVKCVIKNKVPLTDDILTKSKLRYDTEKILSKFNSNNFTIVITEKDISCRDGKYPEWGIFGLGLLPGKICVLSSHRLKKNVTHKIVMERLNKVAVHELGHNFSLGHCSNSKNCFMNDADGTIKQVDREKIWLCDKCRKIIKMVNPHL